MVCILEFGGYYLLTPQSGALRRSAYRDFHPILPILPILPLTIAFEHLSLYIQKHFGPVSDGLWKGRLWQTKAEPGTVGHSAEKDQSCDIFFENQWNAQSIFVFLKRYSQQTKTWKMRYLQQMKLPINH